MKLAEHQNTPSVTVNDGRGLPICEVAYLRKTDGSTESLITRNRYDAAGWLTAQCDSRLAGSPRPNLTNVFGLSGQSLKIDSVDAGRRLILPGLTGEVRQRWDERDNHWRNTYDENLRLLTVDENTHANVEVFTYWQGDAPAGNNVRGQLQKKVDPGGSIEFQSFSLNALPFEEIRTMFDAEVYTTQWTYNAQGQPLSQRDAGGHQQRSGYNIAGQLNQVILQIDAVSPPMVILEDARYNAEGQVFQQVTGNTVVRTWTYDLADGRLNKMEAGIPGQALLQNLEYFYDPVGNVTGIFDHAFKAVFFKNQLIDGRRKFTYNSLYQLTSATGHDATPAEDVPGHPLPTDPNNHLNYQQDFTYDRGGNLIKLTHSRAVGGYTQQMCIDPLSNRGVRWKPGDLPPDFKSLFDRHGNLQTLQPGKTLHWNNRDEPSSITLIKRESGLDDKETYRYSNGVRVFKRHETHTSSTSHFQEVRYLNGLEIRTHDSGEVLHVITLPATLGSVRCLHWVSKKPDGIDNNQVRYILDDQQSSSRTEIDQDARLISHEGYYSFGGTAFLTEGSAPGINYKTIRYSGKEMDVTGLYYYGRRYYAPWLQRWVSADPAWDVDGLNLYAMVGNNPMTFFDKLGLMKGAEQTIRNISDSMITSNARHPFVAPAKTPKKVAVAMEAEHKAEHPHYDYTKSKKQKLVTHAGGLVSDADPEQSLLMTGFHNIPHPSGISSVPGLSLFENDDSQARGFRIYKVDDPGKVKNYLNDKYQSYYAPDTSTVAVFKGNDQTPINFKDVQRENTSQLLSSDTWNATLDHILQNNYLIPEPDGLPAAHGEILVKNTASQLKINPESNVVKIWTFKIQDTPATIAFPACTNCTGILRSAQGGNLTADIQTGYNDEKLLNWRSAQNFN